MPEDRTHYFVNADRTAIVDEGSDEASFMVHGGDLKALGLTPPKAAKAASEPADSDTPADEAGAKAVSGPPANKAQTSASTKGNGN